MDTLQEFRRWLQAKDDDLAQAIRSSEDMANPLQKHRHEMERERLCTALNLIDDFTQSS
jgi:hypothetical protein